MTREEAIVDIRDNIKPVVGGKSLDMAIKALEQKPKTIQEIQAESEKYEKAFEDGYEQGYAQARFDYEQEPCEDAISRQAVINLIRRCNSALEEPRVFDCHNAGVKFEQYVTELQSVKPQEPKTGHWKYIQYDKPQIGNWHCSECGRIVFLLKSQKPSETPLYDYCPWCGVKMESEDV